MEYLAQDWHEMEAHKGTVRCSQNCEVWSQNQDVAKEIRHI